MNIATDSSVTGTVVVEYTVGQRAVYRLEAHDSTHTCPDLVAVAFTDTRGEFTMRLSTETLRALFPMGAPPLYFRVFAGDRLLASTEKKLTWTPAREPVHLVIPIEPMRVADPVQPAPLTVRGRISRADGRPAPRMQVRLFDRSLSPTPGQPFRDDPIASTTSDVRGEFAVQLPIGDPGRGQKITPDLVVKVFGPVGGEPLALVGPICHAPATVVLAIALPVTKPKLSEFERLRAAIDPELRRAHMELAEVQPEAVEFLACTTGVDVRQLATLRDAAERLQDLGPRVPSPELLAILYGLARRRFSLSLESLLRHDAFTLSRALAAALKDEVIPARLAGELDALLVRLRHLLVEVAMRSGDVRQPTAGDVLSASLASPLQQRAFLNRYLSRSGPERTFWEGVDETGDASGAQELRFTLQIAAFVDGNVGLLRRIQALRRQTGRPSVPEDLLDIDRGEWIALAAPTLPFTPRRAPLPEPPLPGGFRMSAPPVSTDGAADAEPPEISKGRRPVAASEGESRIVDVEAYVDSILSRLRVAYPHVYLRQRLARPPAVDLRLVRALRVANPGLDPRRRLPDEPLWGQVAQANRDAARASWDSLVRERRMHPDWDPADTLDAPGATGFRNPVREGVNRILESLPNLNLRSARLDRLLKERPELLDRVDPRHREAAVEQLLATQRLFKVSPNAAHVEDLLAAGYRSARQIAVHGKRSFGRRFEGTFGSEAAAASAHDTATNRVARIDVISRAYQEIAYEPMPRVMKGFGVPQTPPPDRGASVPTLFGTQVFCACDDCASILSPAAYFVDLLNWIDDKSWEDVKGKNYHNPYDALVARRPDLPNLPLSCENTTTPLPYIDIVNEVLEAYIDEHYRKVAGSQTLAVAVWDTGKTTAKELRAAPQHLNLDVYDFVAKQVHPTTLPFDRWLVTARTYLAQLGTSREEIMRTLAVQGDPTDAEIARESLGMSAKEWEILTETSYEHEAVGRTLWGLTTTAPDHHLYTLMQRANLDYQGVLDLIETRAVNPAGKESGVHLILPEGDACDIDGTTLAGWDTASRLRIQRFVRLWRRLGGTMADVDRQLHAFGGAFTADALVGLADARRVAKRLKLPILRVLPLWSRIDTSGEVPLYESLFQSKAVRRILKDGEDDFALAGSGPDREPAGGDFQLAPVPAADDDERRTRNRAVLRAALRCSDAELDAWLADAFGEASDAPPAMLTVNSLSRLYRRAVLARALKQKPSEFKALRVMTGIEPVGSGDEAAATPAETMAFIEASDLVRSAGFTVPALAFLLRAEVLDPARSPGPIDATVDAALEAIRARLVAVHAETEMPAEISAEVLKAKLMLAVGAPSPGTPAPGGVSPVDRIVAVITGQIKDLPLPPQADFPEIARLPLTSEQAATRPDLVAAVVAEAMGLLGSATGGEFVPDPLVPFLTADVWAQIGVTLRTLVTQSETDGSGAVTPTDGPHAPQILQENVRAVLTRLLPWLRDRRSHDAVVDVLSDQLSCDPKVVKSLASEWLPAQTADSGGVLVDLLAFGRAGLRGRYFDHIVVDPETPGDATVDRVDEALEYQWSMAAPPPSIGADGSFTVIWDGRIRPLVDGPLTLTVRSGLTVTLSFWLDDTEASRKDANGDLNSPATLDRLGGAEGLLASETYRVRVFARGSLDSADPNASAAIALQWSSPKVKASAPPVANLFPTDQDAFETLRTAVRRDWRLLWSATEWCRRLRFTWEEAQFFDSSAILPDFFWRDFPISPGDPMVPFAAFEQAARFAALRDSFPQRERTLVSVFVQDVVDPETESRARFLSEASGWEQAQIEGWIAATGMDSEDFFTLDRLTQLREAFRIYRRVGVGLDKLLSWARGDADADQAMAVVNTVRSKYEDEEWYEVGAALNDPIREASRDAMVAYLVAKLQKDLSNGKSRMRDGNNLYEFLLIDVEMCACQLTTRVRQGIASVQQFIQRIFLGLEALPEPSTFLKEIKVYPEQLDAEQWNSWRSRYRVWEANRKVFFYPENWILPELRDDKSPFFKELEDELKQTDLSVEAVEDACIHYLDKLVGVGRLEVVAFYWQYQGPEITGSDTVDVLHVFGRTPSPCKYFYRQWRDQREWTPWEAVDIEVAGENVLHTCVVVDQRLHFVWVTAVEKAYKALPQPRYPNATPNTFWELKASTLCRINNGWSHKSAVTVPETICPVAHLRVRGSGQYKFPVDDTNDPIPNEDATNYTLFEAIPLRSGTESPNWAILFDDPSVIVAVLNSKATETGSSDDDGNWTFETETTTQATTMVRFVIDRGTIRLSSNPFELNIVTHNSLGGQDSYDGITNGSQDFWASGNLQVRYLINWNYSPTTESWDVLETSQQPSEIVRSTDNDLMFRHYPEPMFFNLGGISGLRVMMFPAYAANSGEAPPPISFDADDVTRLRFHTMEHPFARDFLQRALMGGISSLLTIDVQSQAEQNKPGGDWYSWWGDAKDHPVVAEPYPSYDVDFTPRGSYSLYNWELFFHAPFLIACRLMDDQRFAEARRWLHYIFDPTKDNSEPEPSRYWNFKPFHDNKDWDQTVQELFEWVVDQPANNPEVDAYLNHPFEPHRIARFRVVAYQKAVVMKYIDNLIKWGDLLFTQDTMESVAEATQLYVAASDLLGPRPVLVPPAEPPPPPPPPRTYAQLRSSIQKVPFFDNNPALPENVS